MGISDAMRTATSGISSNSDRLRFTAENIANSRSTGYKRSFVDFVTQSAQFAISRNSGVATSVSAVARSNVDEQGALEVTGVATDLAISGEGFFVVGQREDRSDILNFSLTRVGSFRADQSGILRNTSGSILYGIPYDEEGNLGVFDRTTFEDLQPVNVKNVSVRGNATNTMALTGNLPAQATGAGNTSVAFRASYEYFSPLGEAKRLVVNWTPTTIPSSWTLSVEDSAGSVLGSVDVSFQDSGLNTGTPAAWSNSANHATPPQNFSFDEQTGTASLLLSNGSTPQTLSLHLGEPGSFVGVTQFAGDFKLTESSKNGAEAGELSEVQISEGGIVFGVFDTGFRKLLYLIPIANVQNANELAKRDGGAFALSRKSGTFSLEVAGGANVRSIVSGSLERSTTELSQEIIAMIETQRSFSANAKTFASADEMLNETNNIKR